MFTQVVVPELERACEGCHFPGGSFYASFPFDESRIVLDRIDEILMRLPDDSRKSLEYWKSIAAP
jgi:hypothetical protein